MIHDERKEKMGDTEVKSSGTGLVYDLHPVRFATSFMSDALSGRSHTCPSQKLGVVHQSSQRSRMPQMLAAVLLISSCIMLDCRNVASS